LEFLETSDLIDMREDSEQSFDFFLVLTKKWKTATTNKALIININTTINKITPIEKFSDRLLCAGSLTLELLVVIVIVLKVSVAFN
jgi:hypothetical protein